MVQATVKCTVQAATSFAEHCAAGDGAALEAPTCARPVRVRAPEEFEADSWKSVHATPEQAQLFTDLHRSDPQAAHQHVQGAAAMPEVGTELLGFRLIALLGKGAVAQVYLAQQGDLANRYVVVKVSPTIHQEMRTLAQLQHTNIVPVYSVHAAGPLQAVCMPYFGATTLADVLRELGTRPSLPQSGRDLISTIIGYKSTVRDVEAPSAHSGSASPAAAPAAAALPAPVLPPSVGSTGNLEILHGLSYVEAVLWLASRLADGLAHAHERGIVHRDLKPANILLTDEGQPMLLDFDLAHDTKRRGPTNITHIGGTLPYMAPEQIQALRAAAVFTDYRGDIYSFGVILCELLTGRHPFPTHSGSVRQVLESMIQDRQAGPPPVRSFNKAVSPAVESIVRHCLEPDRKRRYQSVLQLKEDLDRHLEHRPLRYAPEPSLRERAAKWKRRHPRLASTTTVAALAGLVIAGLLGLVVVRGQRLAEIDARASLGRFLDDKKTVQYLLTARTNDADQLDAGVKLCRAALDSYGLLDDASWRQRSDVRRLSERDKALLSRGAGEMLLLLAQALTLQAENPGDGSTGADLVAEALRLNHLAETFADAEPARALWVQRAELSRLLGQTEEAAKLRAKAKEAADRTSTDTYLTAAKLIAKGRVHEAAPLLREAADRDPQDFWAWFLLGVCHDQLAESPQSVACYNTCLALVPDSPWAYFNRGLAHLRQQNHKQARADLDRAIGLRPKLAEAYRNRALAHQGLKEYAQAEADLTRALELGASPTQVYFLRAAVRGHTGDRDGAERDRREGLRLEPTDEMGWLARGYDRMSADPEAALADFDRALRLNPRSLAALQNKAHILSKQNRNEEAVRVLDQAVAVYPDFIRARAGRGVLLARLGKREAAHQDADDCLARDNQPLTLYQLAGIYALTSPKNPDDRRQAFRLLSVSLQKGVGFEYLENDRDLDPIRACPEFQTLVDAARAIRAAALKQQR
jgi:serine/threonine protein kinase/tetratricopeptide (TPR) repeat protein